MTSTRSRPSAAGSRRGKSAGRSSTGKGRNPAVVAGAVVAAIAVIALVAVLVFAGGDDTETTAPDAGPARIPSGEVDQVSPIAVTGDALPRFDGELSSDPAIGMQAPSITGSYFDDGTVTVDFTDGRPRVVLFLAHWCPHCQAEVRDLRTWFGANELPTDVDIVAVSTSVDSGAPNYPPSSWFRREQWPSPPIRDSATSDFAAGFGLSSFPFMVVVSGDGEVLDRQTGNIPIEGFEAALARAASS